jgi:hypothetical protein
MKHVYAKHLTIDEWPYQCALCQYSHYNYTNFSSHVKWYEIHRSMAATATIFSLPGQEDIRPESKVVFAMMKQWTIEDSGRYWESRRRLTVPPAPQPPLPSLRTFPTIAPRISQLSTVVPAPAVNHTTAVPALPVAERSTSTLNPEETSILDEFLIMEDSSEFDVENVPPKSTRDVGVNTSPRKDEVAELRAIIERQARALKNNTLATTRLEELLKRHHTQPEERSVHHGPGEGERPRVSHHRKSPPPSRLKSIVYQMPKRPPARSRRPYGRPSPLDELFKPDRNRK